MEKNYLKIINRIQNFIFNNINLNIKFKHFNQNYSNITIIFLST